MIVDIAAGTRVAINGLRVVRPGALVLDARRHEPTEHAHSSGPEILPECVDLGAATRVHDGVLWTL